jgi:hypothetical protein
MTKITNIVRVRDILSLDRCVTFKFISLLEKNSSCSIARHLGGKSRDCKQAMDKSSSRSTRLVPNKNDIKMESRD